MALINSNLKNIVGIYCIENIINNRKYIGSSRNIYSRLEKHMSLLKHNKHLNPILQNSVNKHGIENFKCYLIKECNNEDLEIEEEFYIKKEVKPYNIRYQVIRPINTPEINKKHSDTKKRMFLTGELVSSCEKKIKYYNVKGELLEIFDSIKKCAKNTHISSSDCNRILKNKLLEKDGYFIKYYNDNSPLYLQARIFSMYIRSKKNILTLTNINTNEILYFTSLNVFFKIVKNVGRRKYDKIFSKQCENKIKYKDDYYFIGLVKPCELLENPSKWDNQQLIINGNIYESSTTS